MISLPALIVIVFTGVVCQVPLFISLCVIYILISQLFIFSAANVSSVCCDESDNCPSVSHFILKLLEYKRQHKCVLLSICSIM